MIKADEQDFFNDCDSYKIINIKEVVENNGVVKVINESTNESISASLTLSPREKVIITNMVSIKIVKELGGDF